MRKLLAVVAGAAVAVAVMLAFEALVHIVDASARAPDATVAAMNMPAKLTVAAGWLLGTLAGAAVALRIGRWPPAAWIVGALVLAGGVANIAAIPHPLWMQAAALLAPALGVVAALRVERRRTVLT